MEGDPDTSCFIVEDEVAIDAIKDTDNEGGIQALDISISSSPPSNGPNSEGYQVGNESFNYLEELQTELYMSEFVESLNLPASDAIDPFGEKGSAASDGSSLSAHPPKHLPEPSQLVENTSSSIVDLTTPTKLPRVSGGKREMEPTVLEASPKRNRVGLGSEKVGFTELDTSDHLLTLTNLIRLASPKSKLSLSGVKAISVAYAKTVLPEPGGGKKKLPPAAPRALPRAVSLDALLSGCQAHDTAGSDLSEELEVFDQGLNRCYRLLKPGLRSKMGSWQRE
ncbi:hypothetical protein L0F63_001056 [Massospora cicadina]|nr:hypothetical protein L0F63_001056 [Massospora cicadina]